MNCPARDRTKRQPGEKMNDERKEPTEGCICLTLLRQRVEDMLRGLCDKKNDADEHNARSFGDEDAMGGPHRW